MKILMTLEDTELPTGGAGVSLTILPQEELAKEDYDKEPTKAMWISAAFIELFNTGAIQPIVQQYMAQAGGQRGSEGPKIEG